MSKWVKLDREGFYRVDLSKVVGFAHSNRFPDTTDIYLAGGSTMEARGVTVERVRSLMLQNGFDVPEGD